MSVQSGGGPLRIDPDDAQVSYRGVTLAVKLRIVAWAQVIGCIKNSDGSWTSKIDLTGDLFASDPWDCAYAIEHYGSAEVFVREVVMPRLNEWLAVLFAPGAVPAEDQIATVLGSIKFAPQPDGTLTASM